jgi:PAS domain S-box-containing protein
MAEQESDLATLLTVFDHVDASAREQVRLAQRLIEVLPVPVFFKSRDGNYLGVNKAWEEFFGVPRESIVGQAASYLYAHAPAIAAQHEAMDAILWAEPGRQAYEIALTMRDGRFRHTLYHKATFTDASGNVSGLIGTVIDITDRKRAEQRQSIEHAVTRFLAEGESLGDAVRGILQVMCERLGWVCGARWSLDESDNRLHCVEMWSIDDAAIEEFQEAGARLSFVPGRKGLIREVLAGGTSLWITDVSMKEDFVRAPLAAQAGLKGAFALPILVGNRVMGALEFFSREKRARDEWLLHTAMSVGSQIGQLMARREAEAATR